MSFHVMWKTGAHTSSKNAYFQVEQNEKSEIASHIFDIPGTKLRGNYTKLRRIHDPKIKY